jgi:hypothetical protein
MLTGIEKECTLGANPIQDREVSPGGYFIAPALYAQAFCPTEAGNIAPRHGLYQDRLIGFNLFLDLRSYS